ncbi:MAG: hypothetical protein ABL930_05890 [Pseudobdellovibrio sp.]
MFCNKSEIQLKLLRTLPLHAASGLVKLGDAFYVVADDKLSLFTFSLDDISKQDKLVLFAGHLPKDHLERKKVKPDLECLAYTPEGLLAVPSGSKPNRQMGSFINFRSEVRNLDFSQIYKSLNTEFSELNIEGAAFVDSKLILLQRGNGILAQNALIEIDGKDILEDTVIKSERILKINKINLGKLQNINLGFTDACYADGILFFLAVAEDSNSTYDDGQYVGACIGYINKNAEAILLNKLDCPLKPEGLWVEKINLGYKCYIVTDADCTEQLSGLYMGEFFTT